MFDDQENMENKITISKLDDSLYEEYASIENDLKDNNLNAIKEHFMKLINNGYSMKNNDEVLGYISFNKENNYYILDMELKSFDLMALRDALNLVLKNLYKEVSKIIVKCTQNDNQVKDLIESFSFKRLYMIPGINGCKNVWVYSLLKDEYSPYQIRRVKKEEVKDALDLALRVFLEFEGPLYHEEGINTFKNDIILNKEFISNCEKGICPLYGAFDNNKIVSLIGMRKSKTHINLVFTEKSYMKKGIARALFNYVVNDLKKQNENLKYITLNSSPYGKEFYHKIGFVDLDIEQTTNGIIYTPMIYLVDRKVNIIYPNKKFSDDIFKYKREFIENNDSLDGSASLDEYDNYEAWEKGFLRYKDRTKIDPSTNLVEGSEYLLIDHETKEIIGMINLRHETNDYIRCYVGNVGYSIRPKFRHKGYGTKALEMMKTLCFCKNMKSIYVGCNNDNEGSRRIILNNGGILVDAKYNEVFNHDTEMYLIEIKDVKNV